MRTILIFTAAAAAALATLTACGGGEDGAGDGAAAGAEQKNVVAAFYPLAFAAERTGGESVSVRNLTPPGVEPHDLELAPRDVAEIRSADVVLYLGGGFQPALENAAAGAEGETVDLLAELDVEGDDPHVWLDPQLYADVVRRIAETLTGEEDSARLMLHRLDELDEIYEEGLASCERREIVVGHAAFGYLARSYDLEQVPLASTPGGEATPRDLERIAGLVRDRGITTVFVEPLAPPDEVETIARETGTEVAVLNPLEGLTAEEEAAGEDYFGLMLANLERLREALDCE